MTNNNNMIYTKFCVSMPQMLVVQLDQQMGDIPRSRYLKRILERTLNVQIESKKSVEGNGLEASPSTIAFTEPLDHSDSQLVGYVSTRQNDDDVKITGDHNG